jgi:hypothetical protein
MTAAATAALLERAARAAVTPAVLPSARAAVGRSRPQWGDEITKLRVNRQIDRLTRGNQP